MEELKLTSRLLELDLPQRLATLLLLPFRHRKVTVSRKKAVE